MNAVVFAGCSSLAALVPRSYWYTDQHLAASQIQKKGQALREAAVGLREQLHVL